MISAKIIADSKNEFGDRITTFLAVFPRIILAEVNTHRAFSRNSASSRAIPTEKMFKMVEENPFIPIRWMQDHKGMQGSEYFSDVQSELLDKMWLQARDAAVYNAKRLSKDGVTKQIVNRLLEPFMWHTAIITATDFENFFALRNHEAAEIHLQELAKLMMLAYNDSTPNLLKAGEWHVPFAPKEEEIDLFFTDCEHYDISTDRDGFKLKIATARCARVSYLNHEGKNDYKADLKMYDRLSEMGHWSAFEHCAKSMSHKERCSNLNGGIYFDDKNWIAPNDNAIGWCGNFKGFIQLRKTFENENRKDSRVIKK